MGQAFKGGSKPMMEQDGAADTAVPREALFPEQAEATQPRRAPAMGFTRSQEFRGALGGIAEGMDAYESENQPRQQNNPSDFSFTQQQPMPLIEPLEHKEFRYAAPIHGRRPTMPGKKPFPFFGG